MQPVHPLHWDIKTRGKDTHISIEGELSRHTLMPFWNTYKKLGTAFFLTNPRIIWHLGKINQLDSAGFALLCNFLYVNEKKSMQQIASCSSQFLTLADLFNLRSWINIFLTTTD